MKTFYVKGITKRGMAIKFTVEAMDLPQAMIAASQHGVYRGYEIGEITIADLACASASTTSWNAARASPAGHGGA